MLAGLWRQHEMFDGTYDFDDLLDAHEALDWQEENKLRIQQSMKNA